MDLITNEQLRSLIAEGKPPCVSLFLPTHKQGRDVRQDPVELKNLLRIAEERLSEHMRPTEARDVLEPARKLLDDQEFWLKGTPGLAIFICEGLFRLYRLPASVEAAAIVNDHFHIKQLLPMLADKSFYVLALSQNAVRLMACGKHNCELIPLPEDVATSIDQAVMDHDDHISSTVHHQGFGAGGAISGSPHGQGGNNQNELKEDVRFFFRQLDDGVHRVIGESDVPVVLAGADSIVPLYRQITKLRNVAEEAIPGNPEHVSNDKLREKAMEILEPMWHKELNEDQEQFGTAIARGRGSSNIEEVIPAAISGRVATLFVAPHLSKWGRVDEQRQSVELHDEPSPQDEDLIDRAAVQTLLTSGRVVVCDPEKVPGNKELAAIFRY